jgi:hypothetical protein
MPNPSLIKFRDYLTARPPRGSSSPPRTIKADDLDSNFKRCTLTENGTIGADIYRPQYTSEGTELVFSANGREAFWQEIDICVDGVAKKMMVLGTDPY